MFSLHVDSARTWRGGQNQVLLTVNGLRAMGHRAALVAHPDGELRRRAEEGMELLPLAQREALTLFFLEDLSIAQIAEVTGVPEGTVKSRLFHAKRSLRERLSRGSGTLPSRPPRDRLRGFAELSGLAVCASASAVQPRGGE